MLFDIQTRIISFQWWAGRSNIKIIPYKFLLSFLNLNFNLFSSHDFYFLQSLERKNLIIKTPLFSRYTLKILVQQFCKIRFPKLTIQSEPDDLEIRKPVYINNILKYFHIKFHRLAEKPVNLFTSFPRIFFSGPFSFK